MRFIASLLIFIFLACKPIYAENVQVVKGELQDPFMKDSFLVVLPLSGSLEHFGKSAENGVNLAFKKFGGAFNVIFWDENKAFDKNILKFISEKTILVIGHFLENKFLEDSHFYSLSSLPVLLTFIGNEESATLNDNLFYQIMPSYDKQGEFLALSFLEKSLGDEKVLILSDSQVYNQKLAKAFEKTLYSPPQIKEVKNTKNRKKTNKKNVKKNKIKALGSKAVVKQLNVSLDSLELDEFKPDVILFAVSNSKALEIAPWLLNNISNRTKIFAGAGLANREIGAAFLALNLKVNFALPVNLNSLNSAELIDFENNYLLLYVQKPFWPAYFAYDVANIAIKSASWAESQDKPFNDALKNILTAPDGFSGILGDYKLKNGDFFEAPLFLVILKKEILPYLP